MRVMVTGATGLLGGHSTAALLAAGHEVTALVRDERKLAEAMASIGVDRPDVVALDAVVGDMNDPGSVRAALDGADAVLHCAALVTLDRRRADEMLVANPLGLRTVAEAALERGVRRIVHTSSTSALEALPGRRLTPDAPVAGSSLAYARSKASCEAIARRYQGEGAPLVVSYPSGILGPPVAGAFGETARQMSGFVAGGVMPTRRAALSFADVRDLAVAHVALLELDDVPPRAMLGGHLVTMDDLARLLREVTGRRFPVPPVPPGALVRAGRALDTARRVVPLDSPMTEEAMALVTGWRGTEDCFDRLGVQLRDPRETLEVSLRAWRAAGLVTARQAGRAAGEHREGRARRPGLVERVKGVKVPGAVLASRPFRAVAPRVIPPAHRFVLRVTGGRTMLDSAAQPMLMLYTTGARTGLERETPIAAVPRPDGRFLVVGSNFARASHPAWTANLLAHPSARVTYRGSTFPVTARLLTGDERAACWEELLEWYPGWRDYLEVTDREFRVFELTPA